jgi:hypothetical protein
MPIENRDLPVGTRLVANYKKTHYVCTVEADEEGKKAFVLEDGKRFKSPSSAASAVMGGSAANGWRFWSVEGETSATTAAQPGNTPPPRRNAGGRRSRANQPEAAAPRPEEGDYFIDGDGRPIPEGETSPGEESESSGQAT